MSYCIAAPLVQPRVSGRGWRSASRGAGWLDASLLIEV
jgi:hypothetical protein